MGASLQLRQAVANCYGRVLFEMASDEKVIQATLKDVEVLTMLLEAGAEDWEILTSAVISREDQMRAIASVSRKLNLHELTDRFLRLLSEKGRLIFLQEILKVFLSAHEEALGKVSGTIEVAQKLQKDEIKSLEDKLSQELDKKITLTEIVDPALLGGAILRVGARMVDTSISSRLSQLKTVMMKG